MHRLESGKAGSDDSDSNSHEDLGINGTSVVTRLGSIAAVGAVVAANSGVATTGRGLGVLVRGGVVQALGDGLDLELGLDGDGEDTLGKLDGDGVEIVLKGDDALGTGVGAIGSQFGGEGGDGSGQLGLGESSVQGKVLGIEIIARPTYDREKGQEECGLGIIADKNEYKYFKSSTGEWPYRYVGVSAWGARRPAKCTHAGKC